MTTTPKILISACLLGQPVRYDGQGKLLVHKIIAEWQEAGLLVSICPEVMAGFETPRPPAEIQENKSGEDVLTGQANILDDQQNDVTNLFIKGAEITLKIAQENQCEYALLTENSPSCGSSYIYDGSFMGQKHTGMGVTTAYLRQHGIKVFSSENIDDLIDVLKEKGAS